MCQLQDGLCLRQRKKKVTQINWTVSINLHVSLNLICFFFLCFLSLFPSTCSVFCSSWWAWLQVISSAYSFLFALLSFKYFSWKNLCHFDVLCKTKWACQNVAFFQICFKGQILYCLSNLIKFPPISMSSPCICSI